MPCGKRFNAIEGLRGWLAWMVVFDHIAWWSGFRGPLGEFMRNLGWPAVTTFIVVSGFVIAHLVLERREAYPYYLLRRFMRLFPLFAACCLLGYFVYALPLTISGFDAEFRTNLQAVVDSTERFFWAHVVAHASLLYGAIPHDWLPASDVAFNMAAWTISLEWQFYIVAPLMVAALVKWPAPAALSLALFFAVTQWLFDRKYIGHYGQPSLLLGMGEFFMLGIVSRLLYPRLTGKVENQYLVLACIVVVYALTKHHALTLWAVVYLGLLVADPPRLYTLALESPLAQYLGARSYSVFLSHFLVVNGCVWLWWYLFGVAPGVVPLTLMVVPSALLLADVTYRWIELPGIRLGSYWCKALSTRPVKQQWVEIKCRVGSP
jgi:peptidoglycan/LPS O-acetylase OafA/YrhL